MPLTIPTPGSHWQMFLDNHKNCHSLDAGGQVTHKKTWQKAKKLCWCFWASALSPDADRNGRI